MHAIRDRRNDVPVAEVAARCEDDDDLRSANRDATGRDRVHSGSVGRRDVDTRVKRPAALGAEARIAEEPAHRMLTVERDDRPRIGDALRQRTRCSSKGRGEPSPIVLRGHKFPRRGRGEAAERLQRNRAQQLHDADSPVATHQDVHFASGCGAAGSTGRSAAPALTNGP